LGRAGTMIPGKLRIDSLENPRNANFGEFAFRLASWSWEALHNSLHANQQSAKTTRLGGKITNKSGFCSSELELLSVSFRLLASSYPDVAQIAVRFPWTNPQVTPLYQAGTKSAWNASKGKIDRHKAGFCRRFAGPTSRRRIDPCGNKAA